MQRVESLLQDVTVWQRLWAIACMASVREDGDTVLQHFAGYALAPTKAEAEQVARRLAVKQWPDAEQWDAWVQEIPESVILMAAQHIRAQKDAP